MKEPITLEGYQVTLRDLATTDLEMVRQWRNDPAVSQYMFDQQRISPEQQAAWFERQSQDPRQRHWVIEYRGQPIGMAYLKTVLENEDLQSPSRVEPGLYIADLNYRGNILAFAPTLLMNDFCFQRLGASCLQATVKADNHAALRYNRTLGYREAERHDDRVFIELIARDYEMASGPIRSFLNRPVRSQQKK